MSVGGGYTDLTMLLIMRMLCLRCLAMLVGITTLIAAPMWAQVQPNPSYRFATGGSTLDIPMEVVANGLVFVQATVNGHGGWFILDNGSQGFSADPEFARRNDLRGSSSATARGGGANAIETQIVRDVEIGLPGMTLTHRNLVLIPLKELEPTVGHKVDGILGSRLFDDFVVVIDYYGRKVSIFSLDHFQVSEGAAMLPVRVDEHGFQYIDATIDVAGKTVSGNFLVDGGSNSYADIYKPFADAHQIPPPGMKLLDEPGTSTGGTTLSRDGRGERIRVGPYSVKGIPITFAGDTEGLMASHDYAGLIGAEVLRRFTVAFDSPEKRIYLTPNHNYGEPARYDESGLRIHAEGPEFHKFVVGRIVSNSAAAEAGFQSGDVIESLDNVSTGNLTLSDLRDKLCEPKAQYSVGVARGDKHTKVELKLRPLI
jgi:Aspartyl protease